MAFRKRSPLRYISSGSCVDINESPDGRVLVEQSVNDFNRSHQLPKEEFTLTEELRNGVPLQEINCSSLIDSNDPLEHSFDTSKFQSIVTPLDSDTTE